MSKNDNPVIEIYKGRPIRNNNTILLRVDQITLKKIIDIQDTTGLSIRKILSYSSAPCDRCSMQPVTVYNDTGELKIERGILSKRIPASSQGNKKRSYEKGKKVIDTSNGTIYKSVQEVASIFNINYPALIDQLNGRYKNNTTFIFYEQDSQLCQNNQQIPG